MIVHKLLPLVALGLNLLLLGSALAPDRRSLRNVRFAYLATALAVWNLGVFGLRASADPDVALFWERVLHVGVIPIPVLFYHYVIAFLALPRRRPELIGGYVLCGVFLAAGPTPLFLRGVTDSDWGFMPAAGPLYVPFFVYFQSYLVLGLVQLVRAYTSQSSSFKRNRTLLVIIGVEVSLLGGIVDIVRFLFRWEWLYPVGIPSNAIFALALGVAIVRYRLMDIGVLAKRIVLYLLTSVALAPILFLGLWALDQFVDRPATALTPDGFGVDTLTRDAAILLLVFTVALPVLRKLEGGLERLMFRRRHGVRDALVKLMRELGSLLEGSALVVPLFMEGEVAGVLVVGEKLSGEIFDGDEIELLEMLAGETVIALKNAGLYQDLRSRMDELQRTQESLLESAKLAAIGELAASVAHEINNPLMVILGNSNLLLRHMPSDSPAFKKVTDIETETKRAGKIVRDLLDFARRREPKRERVSIHELLDRAIELLRPKLAGGSVEVERVFDLSLPPIAGDRDQLTQVFLNLITNALDAMERGGRGVLGPGDQQEGDGRPGAPGGVADTGGGIPPGHRAGLSEPFYTTKDEGRGTGLGHDAPAALHRVQRVRDQ